MTHLARARSIASLTLAVLSTVALLGCQDGAAPVEPPAQTTSPEHSGPSETTPEETTVTQTYSSAEEAVEAQRDAADRVLDEVLTILGPSDLDQVRDTAYGDAAACTLDAPPALSLILSARVEVEGAVGAYEGARTTMREQDWEPVETHGSPPTTSTHRRGDFLVTIALAPEEAVNVSIESPCFAPDGTRIS